MRPIHENHENYAPQKFCAIRYNIYEGPHFSRNEALQNQNWIIQYMAKYML